jgi:hypothetical protein
MKNWWLRLYTIPSLLITVRTTAILFAIAVLINFSFPDYLFAVSWLSCLIPFAHKHTKENCLSGNVEFHKLHIPYQDLKSAVIKDSLITAFSIFLGCFICIYFAYVNGAFAGEDPVISIFAPLWIQFIMIIQITSVNPVVNGKFSYTIVDFTKVNRFIFYVLVTFVGLGMFLLSLLPVFAGVNPLYTLVILMIGLMFQYSRFTYGAVFHQEKNIGTLKCFWSYLGKGTLNGVGLYLLAAVISFPLVNSTSLNNEIRFSALNILGMLNPELDVEIAKELIKQNRYDSQRQKMVYANAPGINQVPISEILDKPRMSEYVAYLENVENPSLENLNYILANPIKRNEINGYLFSEFNKLVVEKWPKNKKFPEHLLDKTVLTERLPASKK